MFKRIRNDILLHDYATLVNGDQPLKIWLLSRQNRAMSKQCHSAVYLLSKLFSRPYNSICIKCGLVIDNITEHLLLFCKKNDDKRLHLWNEIIRQFGLTVFQKLSNHKPREQLLILFSGLENLLIQNTEVERCLILVVHCFYKMSNV
jgi:hypothetical protein